MQRRGARTRVLRLDVGPLVEQAAGGLEIPADDSLMEVARYALQDRLGRRCGRDLLGLRCGWRRSLRRLHLPRFGIGRLLGGTAEETAEKSAHAVDQLLQRNALVLLLRIHRGGSDHGQCESQDYALCVNPCTSGH